jgi:hypothetical protein
MRRPWRSPARNAGGCGQSPRHHADAGHSGNGGEGGQAVPRGQSRRTQRDQALAAASQINTC